MALTDVNERIDRFIATHLVEESVREELKTIASVAYACGVDDGVARFRPRVDDLTIRVEALEARQKL